MVKCTSVILTLILSLGDSDLTKKRLKELYYIYKDKKKEKKDNYPIVNIINGIFSDNDPGTVDGGQIGSKEIC
jgi:hypothetical protein